jgi:hypothetical protein
MLYTNKNLLISQLSIMDVLSNLQSVFDFFFLNNLLIFFIQSVKWCCFYSLLDIIIIALAS